MYLDSIRIWSLSLLGCSLGQWQDSSVTMGTSVFRGGLVYSNLSPHAAGDIQCDKVTKVVENGNIWKPFWRLCRHSRCWWQKTNILYDAMGKLFDSTSNETEGAAVAVCSRESVKEWCGTLQNKQQKRPRMQRSAFREIIGNENACHILSHLIVQSANLAWILLFSASFTRSIQILLFRDFV